MKQLVYVTGAGRGIGRAICVALVQSGYAVAGCSRTADELDATKQLCNGQLHVATVDVSDGAAVAAWLDRAQRDTGAVPWGLVTAAGIYGPIGRFVENDWAEWKRAIDINLFGTALACQRFAKLLIDAKLPGRIALLSGGGATQPQPRFSSYGAAKAAVVRFGETLAHELAEYAIFVNAIAPGAVNTQFTETLLAAGPERAGRDTYDKVLKQKASGGAPPTKAAALAAFLMSDAAAGITGRLISAIWDPWAELARVRNELATTDIYTLRRIVPEDRPNMALLAKLRDR